MILSRDKKLIELHSSDVPLTRSLSRSLTVSLLNWRREFGLKAYIRTANAITNKIVMKKFEGNGSSRGPGTEIYKW